MPIINIPSASTLDNTPRRVVADICGHFALHHTPRHEALFTITHVPTGRAVRQLLSEASALALMRDLEASTLDWSFDHPRAMTDAHRKFHADVITKYFSEDIDGEDGSDL